MKTQPIITIYRMAESVGQFTAQDWEDLLKQCYANNMMARTAFWLKHHNVYSLVPEQIQWHFEAAWQYFESHKDGVLKECSAIHAATSMGSEPVVFLKGSAYLLQNLLVSQGRLFSDVDILTRRAALTQTEQFLLWNGWQHVDKSDYDQSYYRVWMHELPPFVHGERGTTLDVHHNIVPPISGRSPDVEEFPVASAYLNDLSVSTFSPAAMTLHSIVHLFFEEDFSKGFRDINDIHLLFCEFGNDAIFWRELLSLAERHNFLNEVALACHFSHYFFQSHVPAEVESRLKSLSSGVTGAFNHYIFSRLLSPKGGTNNVPVHVSFAGLLRGHLRKMPIPILVRHTLHKSIDGLKSLVISDDKKTKHK